MRSSDPYFIKEPAAISFSGGRTSAYMLWRVLQAHGGTLPDHIRVVFANTGKEMPETLDFVRDCGEQWGVEIAWVEYDGRTIQANDKNYDYRYRVVDHATASRKGEPFSLLLSETGKLPNVMARWCSGQLKIRTMRRYLVDQGFELPYTALIGIRGDEKRRAVKLHGKLSEGQDAWCPLYVDGVTKEDVGKFWKQQNFDLRLYNNNGVTDWGNCDLCFLKGKSKRMAIIRERPDLADWWIKTEKSAGDQFDRMGTTYAEMKIIATDQGNLFNFAPDESIPCFCGD